MTSIFTLSFLLLLFLQVVSFNQNNRIPPAPSDSLVEDKTRLGSTPPSCHNKCNGCHPCMAVQVPTVPSHERVRPGFGEDVNEVWEPYPSGNRYSNYKPLGWKCRCGGHFYNP